MLLPRFRAYRTVKDPVPASSSYPGEILAPSMCLTHELVENQCAIRSVDIFPANRQGRAGTWRPSKLRYRVVPASLHAPATSWAETYGSRARAPKLCSMPFIAQQRPTDQEQGAFSKLQIYSPCMKTTPSQTRSTQCFPSCILFDGLYSELPPSYRPSLNPRPIASGHGY
ncbi:hypothetical protein BDV19DRAFT_142446 [Aspergillus venezuelensis]